MKSSWITQQREKDQDHETDSARPMSLDKDHSDREQPRDGRLPVIHPVTDMTIRNFLRVVLVS